MGKCILQLNGRRDDKFLHFLSADFFFLSFFFFLYIENNYIVYDIIIPFQKVYSQLKKGTNYKILTTKSCKKWKALTFFENRFFEKLVMQKYRGLFYYVINTFHLVGDE